MNSITIAVMIWMILAGAAYVLTETIRNDEEL